MGKESFIETTYRLIRAAIVVFPLAILGLWGYAYLWGCLQTLTAPGRPIEFRYLSKGGPLSLRVGSFLYTPESGVLLARDLTLRDPQGIVVARVGSVAARGLELFLLGKLPIQVVARNAFAKLELESSGRPKLLRYLPETLKERGKTPFTVRVENLAVDVLTPDGNLSRARTTYGVVEGVGDAWIASGMPLRLSTGGTIAANARNSDDRGLEMQAEIKDAAIAKFLKFFAQTPEGLRLEPIRKIRTEDLVGSGNFWLRVAPGRPAQLMGNMALSSSAVSYADRYRADQARFVGSLTSSGAQGVLDAVEGPTKGKFEGGILWLNGTKLAGYLDLDSPSSTSLPVWARNELPKKISYEQGSFRGWIAYDAWRGFQADGRFDSDIGRYSDSFVRNLGLNLNISRLGMTAATDKATWNGQPVSGLIHYEPKTRAVAAAIQGRAMPLAPIARSFGYRNLQGAGDLRLLVFGTSDRPSAVLRSSGTAEGLLERGGRRIRLGSYNLAATSAGDKARIDRLTMRGPNGSLSASGTVDIKGDRLALDLFVAGFPLARISPDLRGLLSGAARIEGSARAPKLAGRAEVFGARYQDREIAGAVADVTLERNVLKASNARAVVDTFPASGTFAVNLETRRISGKAKATAFLSDLIDNAAGAIYLDVYRIAGTLDKPLAFANATSSKAFVEGFELEEISAAAKLIGTTIGFDSLTAKAGEGSVSASGSYDLKRRTGTIFGRAAALPLDRLTGQYQDIAKVEGLLDAESINLRFDKKGFAGINAGGQLRQLEINDSLFDGGPWELNSAGNVWTGNARLGILERFVQVPNFTYNTRLKNLRAEIQTLDLDLRPLVSAALPYFRKAEPDQRLKPVAELSPENIERLKGIEGLVSASVQISGTTDDLTISEALVDASKLKYQGGPMGTMRADFRRANGKWDVNALSLEGGPVGITAKGFVEEHGSVNLDGEINVRDLHWLAGFDPDLDFMYGTAAVPFLLTGQTKKPNAKASLNLNLLESPAASLARALKEGAVVGEPPPQQQVLAADIPLTLSGSSERGEEYVIEGAGQLRYKVLAGDLSARIPLEGWLTPSKSRSWQASLVSKERPIGEGEVATYLPSLDPKRTNLIVSGNIRAEGVGKEAKFSGKVGLKKNDSAGDADSALAILGIGTSLRTLLAEAVLADDVLRVTVGGESSLAGAVRADFAAQLGNVEDLFSSLIAGSTKRLLDTPISGQLEASNFGFREDNLVPNTPGESGAAAAAISGTILVDRTIGAPRLRTPENRPIEVSKGDFLLPTLPEVEQKTRPFMVVPSFDLQVALSEPAKMRAGNATLVVTGTGAVGGTLALPEIDARMNVSEGVLHLPTTRVRIQEGGDLRLQYRARPGDLEPFSRLDVSLHGKTNLTALRFGTLIERYDIDLFITGNLLGDQPIAIRAESTPADLSTNEILRMLGHAELLESLTASVKSSLGDKNLQQALSTFAVPALFDPFTEELARQLGLDYLALEYNALEQTTVAAAKTLGKGLTLQFRRQLFEPPAGERQRYDFRLTYRIPSRNPLLSRLTFHMGSDQDRPWKIGLEFSTRF